MEIKYSCLSGFIKLIITLQHSSFVIDIYAVKTITVKLKGQINAKDG